VRIFCRGVYSSNNGPSVLKPDRVVFNAGRLHSALNKTSYWLIFNTELFHATGKVLVQGVLFQQRVKISP